MLNIVKELFINKLEQKRKETFPESPNNYTDIISDAVFTSLSLISRSDALYHDVEHTCLVTLCGLEIFAGKKILEGELNSEDWLHFTIALLFHDVGYIKNILAEDDKYGQVINDSGEKYQLKYGATDASLTPYHVERGKLFIGERHWNKAINKDLLRRLISFTQFPIPERSLEPIESKNEFRELAELVGSADIIGQLADPMYDIKIPRLYHEFEETGSAKNMGYSNPGDLRRGYPSFFINFVRPNIAEALRFLSVTEEGRKWVANLNYHIFSQSHKASVEQSGIELLTELSNIYKSNKNEKYFIQEILSKVGVYKGWPLAHAYKVVNENNISKLCSMKIWHSNISDEAYNKFKDISESYIFTSGEGLPGRVFKTHAAQTIYDVTKDPNFPRASLAKKSGVRGAFAFPLIIDGAVEYVLEFFSPEPEHLDPSVLELLKLASTQLSKGLAKNV